MTSPLRFRRSAPRRIAEAPRRSQQNVAGSRLGRPKFVNQEFLKEHYSCELCACILIDPQQTLCGARICKPCLSAEFRGSQVINCPLTHAELDDEELIQEECQSGGIRKTDVFPDAACQRILLKEKCHCQNAPYGCKVTPQWKDLEQHLVVCPFQPEEYSNQGCAKVVSSIDLPKNREDCSQTRVNCHYCGYQTPRKNLEKHSSECDFTKAQCNQCIQTFNKHNKLVTHQKTHIPCMTRGGKCYYYDQCKVETDTLEEPQDYMREDKDFHLQPLALKTAEAEHYAKAAGDAIEPTQRMNERVSTVENNINEIVDKAARLQNQLDATESAAENLVDSMRKINCNRNQAEELQKSLSKMEQKLCEGLDYVPIVAAHTADLNELDPQINVIDESLHTGMGASYEGYHIWKISNFNKRKDEAGKKSPVACFSYPFYTSVTGYKMCGRACLNGEGDTYGEFLSLHFVLLKGEFDQLLEFPFKHSVTISLLSPKNPSRTKQMTLVPTNDTLFAYKRPTESRNQGIGFRRFIDLRQLALDYIVDDSIYIRYSVLRI